MEGAIEAATVHIEGAMVEDTAAATAAIAGATLRDITTVGTTTQAAITDGTPGTTTEDGLPMVQHSGSSREV